MVSVNSEPCFEPVTIGGLDDSARLPGAVTSTSPEDFIDGCIPNLQTTLDLKPVNLMTWKGKGYWCVNLLETSVEVYSTEDCEEDVEDAG